MGEMILPESLAAQLQGLSQPVQLCDASGKRLGCFVPAVDPSEYEIIGPEPTEEELRRAEESGESYSTEQLLRHLERLQ